MGKPGPWNTVLRWLQAISIPNRQFGGRGGKSIETGKGGRSSAGGGLPAAAVLGGGVAGGVDGVAALGGNNEGVAAADAAGGRLGNNGSDPKSGLVGGRLFPSAPGTQRPKTFRHPGQSGR